jgi:cell division protein FtsB
MNLSQDKRSPVGGHNAGAVAFGGHNNAAPAQFAVGEVGFGPNWSAEDSMAASIVRLECEADELRAEVAMLQEQARIITEERDEARIQYRSTEALGMALVKTIGEMKAERVDLKAKIEALRDQLCADKCRDKAQADGGWANI